MPVGNIRKLRPVHQFLKADADGNILLDQYGIVQNVIEDFDDNDVVDTKHLIPTHIVEFDSISDRNTHNTTAWLRGDIAIVDGGSTKRVETGTYVYIGSDQSAPAISDNDDWLLITIVGQFNLLEFTSISLRNSNSTVSWLKGDLAVVDGGSAGRDDTGTYIYIGSDQSTPVATGNSDWLILSSAGQHEISNQLDTWDPLADYTNSNQVVFDGKFYTVNRGKFLNTTATEIVITGDASNVNPRDDIAASDPNDTDDTPSWIVGIATAIQGVRADTAVQPSQFPDEYTRDGNIFGVKFEDEFITTPIGTVEATGGYTVSINATLLEKLLDRPEVATDPNNNQNNILVGNPKKVFLKFNPNPPANAGYKASTISYADLEESPAVFKFIFDNVADRNANLDFLNSDGDEYAVGETKDGIIDIVWVTGDQVIVTNDTVDANGDLEDSKGAYVYIGDTLETAAVTTNSDWQFVGINSLAETAIQIVQVNGVDLSQSPDGTVNIDISGKQDNLTADQIADINRIDAIETAKQDNLTADQITDINRIDAIETAKQDALTTDQITDINRIDAIETAKQDALTSDQITDINRIDAIETAALQDDDVTVTGSTSITVGTKTFTPVSGSAITIQDEGTGLTTGATALNFTGNGVVASGTGATKTITITDNNTQLSDSAVVTAAITDSDFAILQGSTGTKDGTTVLHGDGTWSAGGSAIVVQEEGSDLTTAATTINFTGDGVVASGTGTTKTINIVSGSGATTALTARVQNDTFTHSGSTGLDNNTPGTAEIIEVELTSNSTANRNDFWGVINNSTGEEELFSGFPGNGLCYNKTDSLYASVFFNSLFTDSTNFSGNVVLVSGEEAAGTLSDKIDGWISAYNAISLDFSSPSTIDSDEIVRGYTAVRDANKITFTCETIGVNLADLTYSSTLYSANFTVTDGETTITSGALTEVTYNIQGQDVAVSFPSETADGTAQATHSQSIIAAAVTGVTITRSGAVISVISNGFVANTTSGITVDTIGTFSSGTYTDPVVASVTTGELITKDVDRGVTAIVSRLSDSPILYQALIDHTDINANSSFSNTSEWITIGDNTTSVGDIKVGNIPTGSGTDSSSNAYLIYTYNSTTYYVTINSTTGIQTASTSVPS